LIVVFIFVPHRIAGHNPQDVQAHVNTIEEAIMKKDAISRLLGQPTIRVDDLAEILDCGRDAAYEKVRSGEVASIRVGRCIRIPTAPLKRLLGMDCAN
jgi:excisionase family DNA binding protein